MRATPARSRYRRRVLPAIVHASILEQRRLAGHDRYDEMWSGTLYMMPIPGAVHSMVMSEMFRVLDAIAARVGLVAFMRLAVMPAACPDDDDYRVPDLVVVERRALSTRGVEGNAVLAVEVLSPGDESRKKLPFYARVGVCEVWLVDPAARAVEIHVCALDGTTRVVEDRSPALDLGLSIRGAELRITDGDSVHVVDLAALDG